MFYLGRLRNMSLEPLSPKLSTNTFMTKLPIIKKPVHWFAVQIDIYIYVSRIHKRFKSEIYNHQVRQVFRTWDLNQQKFVQEIEIVDDNALDRSISLKQMRWVIWNIFTKQKV